MTGYYRGGRRDTQREKQSATKKDERMTINDITGQIIDAAIKVHSALGPGLLESAYEACLMYALNKRGLVVRNQVPLSVKYEDVIIKVCYRIDLLVAESVIVELKSVDGVAPIHKAQLLSYLKLSGKNIGLLIN